MKKFLVEVESGKNNIGGHDLHIVRGSHIVEAEDIQEAFKKGCSLDLYHFDHRGDYKKVTAITELKSESVQYSLPANCIYATDPKFCRSENECQLCIVTKKEE